MTLMEDLSEEIMLCIFSNLSMKELIPLQRVSQRWRRLAQDRTFYTVMSIAEDDAFSRMSYLLRLHKENIRHLNIVQRSDIELLIPFIFECRNLETLSIKLCNGDGDQIPEIVNRCERIRTIILQNTPSIRRLSELFQVMATRPMKKIVIRSMNEDIETDDLSCLQHVEDLRLRYIGVHPMAIQKFCVHNYLFLTVLKLIVSDKEWIEPKVNLNETLFKAIGTCSQLKTLCLGAQVTSHLNDTGFSHISKLNSLTTLEIHNAIGVSVNALKEYFLRPAATNLCKLNLYKCSAVNSTILQTIARRCSNLKKFTLEKSKVAKNNTDLDDVVLFAKNCKQIRKLYLFGMHILVAEVLHIMPEYLPKLESLKYSNSDAPMKIPAILPILQELMPEFEVCGLQWTFSLYVHCTKKAKSNTIPVNNLMCGSVIKIPALHCS